jgi:cysteine desulfurase/selenocysteine lyase
MNVEKIRKDFPFYDNNPGSIYMDSACMSLRPRQVIAKIDEYYEKYPACAGRSAHKFAKRTEDEYQAAREQIRKFVGAKNPAEIIFTRNTTEGLNMVAKGLSLSKGDIVLSTDREHNSNLVPWLKLAKEKSLIYKVVRSREDMTFDIEGFKNQVKGAKVVSMVHSSNLDGYTLPAREIINISHEAGAMVVLDGAQSVPHKDIDVRKLDVDFLAFSGHKMVGPSGTGVLYGKLRHLQELDTYNVGGDTVADTTYGSYEFLPPPDKFEAGLQNYAGAIGLAEASRYLKSIGLHEIAGHETSLNEYITDALSGIDGLQIIGPPESKERGGVIDFTVTGIDHHEIALMLSNSSNIMIRSGQHCVHSWFNAHGMKGSCRASLYMYNTRDEAARFVEELSKIVDMMR